MQVKDKFFFKLVSPKTPIVKSPPQYRSLCVNGHKHTMTIVWLWTTTLTLNNEY